MLKVDDRFKSWMRKRLQDREYAERVMRAVTELRDVTLTDTWRHAALPPDNEAEHDPEAMIGMIMGHDRQKDKDFIAAIFGKWEDFQDLCMPYAEMIWRLYHPVTNADFSALPDLYEIAFQDADEDPNHAINRIRWRNKDGVEATEFGFDRFKINVINTKLDSHVIRVITGADLYMSDSGETIDYSDYEVVPREMFSFKKDPELKRELREWEKAQRESRC